MYKIFLDKPEDFICEIQVKNASLKNSIARLIMESTDGLTLVFNGKLENNKCVIPIKRLKGLMEENVRGNIHLEVIVEDTYFKPWQSEFIVEEHTSVKVKVDEQKQSSNNKPMVEMIKPPISKVFTPKKNVVSSVKNIALEITIPKKEIAMLCETFGIKRNNFDKKRKELIQILKEYFKINPEYNNHKKTILRGIYTILR